MVTRQARKHCVQYSNATATDIVRNTQSDSAPDLSECRLKFGQCAWEIYKVKRGWSSVTSSLQACRSEKLNATTRKFASSLEQ